ncbi:angiotensin-converting enzyme-like isoform X2 [Plodia interpunctella]|uniref:angiotensin-converting enzyme-like isoform X2 n=1 Tax=Plodia interpunctella TaxID=58824 RepID=UPI0023675B0B|nr:angiotensin-converting enzyme-like isoform X2 [Plodia interpunctella]
MKLFYLIGFILVAVDIKAVQFPANPNSDVSADEKSVQKINLTIDQSDESGHENNSENSENDERDKKFLDFAMRTVLDPNSVIQKSSDDVVENFKQQLEELDHDNMTLTAFMEEMDNISLEICKTSQQSLWSYVTDINNEIKKNKMVRIAAEEDEIKKQYWNIIKKKYLDNDLIANDTKLQRKLRIIKERGTNVQMPQSKQREEIDMMQRIWSRVTVCAYNSSCNSEDGTRTMSDIIQVFKTSNNSKELAFYWKAYRDATGKKIRPIFKDYVTRMNRVANSENFTDAGEMWRYAFEDDHFMDTVERIWHEIQPFYNTLHDYVRIKLKQYYKRDLSDNDNYIPAQLLGNLWAQEWQAVYPKVAAFPDRIRPHISSNESLHARDLFEAVDAFHQSIGFESAQDSYKDIRETMMTANCLPSSHDMCDGVHYKIKWCGEKVTDIMIGLSRAARLLGHVQYFKHYRHLPPLYRDGPTPAFHDAVSDIVAIQLTTPDHLKNLNLIKETGSEVTLNHLLWIALEKFPLMAYAYVLDKWRWDIFSNNSLENWNQHWWYLRKKETGVSAPVPRNESDLDPAAKYHVVSHVQYITYLISHVLEFQILSSLCKQANHTGPLHECSIYGVKEAGKLLSDGMALGASEDWRTVLKTMTGETELSTKGILDYFSTLQEYLQAENAKYIREKEDMDQSAPIIVGIIVVALTLIIIVLYIVKKQDWGGNILSLCGLSKNGSLDIVTNDITPSKTTEVTGVTEEKV